MTEQRIHCANCVHCKLIRDPLGNGLHYRLRVRCEAGHWLTKRGDEKLQKYFTIGRRTVGSCDAYSPMGDEDYLSQMRASLPKQDEIFSYQSSPAYSTSR